MVQPAIRSPRPQKHLLFSWLAEEFENSRNKKIGLDVACGDMSFKRFFQSDEYIGVDIDEQRIKAAAERHAPVRWVVSSIEELPEDLRGDYVACIQTIGCNVLFENDKALFCVEKLVAATNAGGDLVFNVGPPVAPKAQEILELVSAKFTSVEVRAYGAFTEERPQWVASSAAWVMDHLPFLRTVGSGRRHVYFCRKKKG